jgi:hypothetical protein
MKVMDTDFAQHRFDDSVITELHCYLNYTQVTIRNWRDQLEQCKFIDYLAIEGYGFIDEDLSHGTQTVTDPLITKGRILTKETADGYACFNFYSAWSDSEPILKVVAKSFECRILNDSN